MLQLHQIMLKHRFTIEEVCNAINKIFQFKGRDIISQHDIIYWKKKELIKTSKNNSFTLKEVNNLKGLVFLYKFLGIRYDRIRTTQNYLKNLPPEFKNYIRLYEGNYKQ